MLRVFGPTRLDGPYGTRELGSRRQRQLLAALAARKGRAVSIEVLVEWMWGDQAPSDPSAAVQTVIHRVRRSVGPTLTVQTHDTGYLLDCAAEGVDAIEYERLIRAARTADPAVAVEHVETAMALWQGEPYADMDHSDFLVERGRLEGLADEAHALLTEAFLRLGRHREALVLAEETLTERPQHERALAVVMTALYAMGEQVEALHRFTTYRDWLTQELGLDPSPRLRELEAAILQQREDLPVDHSGQPATELVEGALPTQRPTTHRPPVTQHIRFCRGKDGSRLAYATSGRGAPLVKAATWMTHLDYDWDSPVWRHWLVGLSTDHTLVRYDERGCGLSAWDVRDFGLEAWVDDLELVVDAEGLERFPLLGISQGAAVAIAYAVRHPERVSALILFGGYARGRGRQATSEVALGEASLQVELARLGWGSDDPAFRQVFTSQIFPDATRELWMAFNELQARTTSAANAVRFMEAFAQIDVAQRATQVTCPTLIMHSRDEVRQPVQRGLELASLIPDSRFVGLPSRNHLLTSEEPAWQMFLEHIKVFLDGL
ncbi:MAG: alpha/beta fold hydrolase [Ornithinimicrobium sp.]